MHPRCIAQRSFGSRKSEACACVTAWNRSLCIDYVSTQVKQLSQTNNTSKSKLLYRQMVLEKCLVVVVATVPLGKCK
eukprot:2594122-Amphidinium_carterae.1